MMQGPRFRKQIRIFIRNKVAVAGTIFALILILMSILAPLISPYDPVEQNVLHRLKPPGIKHLLGTDFYGRDVLSRIIWGSRISLAVGIGSIIIGLAFGTLVGMIAAFTGGKLSNLMMRSVDVMLCFPAEIFAILVLVVLGQGLNRMIMTIGIVMCPRFARLSYGTTLSVKERDFIDAAKSMGARNSRILLGHLLPNIFGEILVISSLWTAVAIRVEANLSFLGLGVPPPTATWGNMVRLGVEHLINAPWLSVVPGLAIMFAVLAFNLIGDGMRDVLDPKLYG